MQSLTSVHHDDCLGANAPVIAVSTAIHAGCESNEAQIHRSISTVAIESPSSATLPSWAKLPSSANLPSLAKLPSLANSPLGEVVVGTCLPWQSCHWHHHQHPAGVDAGIVLSSLQTLPWWSCGPPFHGRQHPPLGPWLFWSLPSTIGAHPGLCPFVV